MLNSKDAVINALLLKNGVTTNKGCYVVNKGCYVTEKGCYVVDSNK